MDITDLTFIVDQREVLESSSEKTGSSSSTTESSTEEIYEEDMISGDDSNETTYAATSIIEDVSQKPKQIETTNKTTILLATTPKTNLYFSQQLITPNNTDLDIKNRDALLNQELKMRDLERIDTNNRFVYHHLPNTGVTTAPSNKWYPSASGSPAFQPISATDQVKLVHKIVEAQREQNKIRFPATSENLARDPTGQRPQDDSIPKPIIKPDIVRFPGASTNRFSVYPLTANTNRPAADNFNGRKSISVSTTQKPFWW